MNRIAIVVLAVLAAMNWLFVVPYFDKRLDKLEAVIIMSAPND